MIQATRRSWTRRSLLAVAAVAMLSAATIGVTSAASPAPTDPAAHRFCTSQWRALQTDRTVASLRAVGDCEIDRRLATLTQLDARVAAARSITQTHASQLRIGNAVNPASYEAESAGLTSLKGVIDGETDVSVLRDDIRRIAEDYRVYLLVVPKTHLVAGADALAAAAAKLDDVAGRLGDLIERARARGKDVSQAAALLDDLKRTTGQASSLVSGLADALLPISPADYNAGPGKAALDTATSLNQGRELITDARQDARQILELLRP